MNTFETILGLPESMAIAALESRGINVTRVTSTVPPREPDKQGTLRVVAVRDQGQTLVIAAFSDAAVSISECQGALPLDPT